MWKTISAIAAAATIAGAINLLPGSSHVEASARATSAKADRADLEQICTQQSWPYYKASCLRDDSRNAGRVLKVRVISTDRIPQANPDTNYDLAPHWPAMLAELQIATPAWARGTK